MAEQAPSALRYFGSRISPDLGGVLSGIIGDRRHDSGYHRGRSFVPRTDYSVQLPEDKLGDGNDASAIDLSFSPAKMKLYTGRLKAAAERNDPRMKYVREFYGTLDGVTVFGRTHKGSSDSTWEWATSDKSHLWHIHISILRKYADNKAVMQGILDVLMGKPVQAVEENDMDARQERLVIKGAVEKDNALYFWLRTAVDQNDPVIKQVWGHGGTGPGLKQIAELVTTLRTDLVARDEADKVRDAGSTAAIKALSDTLNKVVTGGGSVDSAAIVEAVRTEASKTQAKVAELYTKVTELETAVSEREAEVEDLKRRLSDALRPVE